MSLRLNYAATQKSKSYDRWATAIVVVGILGFIALICGLFVGRGNFVGARYWIVVTSLGIMLVAPFALWLVCKYAPDDD